MKNLANGLFHIVTIDERTPRCGGILVAEPFLKDNDFSHGVVSLIDYLPEEGATGIVMNNRTDYMLSDLLEGTQPEVDLRVFCGGPLGLDRLYFVHTLGSDIVPGAREYSPGLYVGGDFDAVLDYINCGFDTNGIIRFFIGYSNWAPGQLEREIREGTWAQAPSTNFDADILRGEADSYWHRAVRTLGEAYRPWQLLPRTPSHN